jgi:hypothetical protein
MCYFLFLVTDNGNLDEAKVKKFDELMSTMMNGIEWCRSDFVQL